MLENTIEASKKMTVVVNDCVAKFIDCLTPSDFSKNPEDFVIIATAGAAMLSATIVDKISYTLGIDENIIIVQFGERMLKALEMIKLR